MVWEARLNAEWPLVARNSCSARYFACQAGGLALATLGERESGTTRLEDAVAAYREALKEITRTRIPLDWAMTQNNLGTALWMLGERTGDALQLKEAREAIAAAFDVVMQAGQEQYSADFEKRLSEIDRKIADFS
jgi:hypothetical protein